MEKKKEKFKKLEGYNKGDKNEDMKERIKGIERKMELKDREERKKM